MIRCRLKIKKNGKKESVIFLSYLLEAFEVDLYVPITLTEIREEGINVRTDDQRCVKTSFARLLPDSPPSARRTDTLKSSLTGFKLSAFRQRPRLKTIISTFEQELRGGGGGRQKQVGRRKKERDGSNWIHRFLRN